MNALAELQRLAIDVRALKARFQQLGELGGIPGPQGPQGPQGPKGDPGDATTYVHTQSIPSSTWTINHNLARYPSVTVVDSTGGVLFGAVEYVNQNTVIITFGGGTAGQAFLN
ncbi:MAG: hypothetical protein IRZ28_17200 [Steroidobacteraceae bacterium]|nr:hypothetical protein [Steroidobacteraceae bacterium]